MRLPSCALGGVLLFFSSLAAAQAPVPVGKQFQVNTSTASSQVAPVVIPFGNGGFVVVWQDARVRAQRFDALGAPSGAEFAVSTDGSHSPEQPAASPNPAGGFFAAWACKGIAGDEQLGILGRRFDAYGQPEGNPFHVNTFTKTIGDSAQRTWSR